MSRSVDSVDRALPERVVEIVIPDWEIECCAPPPVTGAVATWSLEFVSASDDLAHQDVWTVTRRVDGAVLLEREGIHAAWNTSVAPPPRAGIHMLSGRLHGTVHGSVRATIPAGLPPVAGRVQRIRIVSHEFVRDRAAAVRTLHEVHESPSRFNPAPTGTGRLNTGVLVDLAVPDPTAVEPS